MRKRLFLATLLIVILSAFPVSTAFGQTNFLTNPGFEPPFNAVGGNQLLQVAQGWTPWHVPLVGRVSSSENVQPEYLPASNTADSLGVPRILSGQDAQQFSAFFATFQGGVFQRVTGLAAGTDITFRVSAYVWSSAFDDPDVSDEDGGVLVQVGIDPTGGESGESTSIVWSEVQEQYDAYTLHSVTARTTGTAATVFVRALVSFPTKNNVVYVDDASLTGAGASGPTATPQPASPTATPVAPTPTPASATNTPVGSAPTATTVAPATTAPTATPVPPTATPTVLPPTNTPVATATQVPPTPTNTPIPITSDFPGRIIHTVRQGDTVSRLATLYGSTTQAIISANGLDEQALIFVGQGLVVPVRLVAPATATPTATPQVIIVTATLAAPTAGAPAPTAVPQPAPGGTTTYVVQPGDTLRRIALRFNTTVSALAQLNGITNINYIQVGQRLTVPGSAPAPTPVPPTSAPGPTATPNQPRTYRIQPGDNLFRIALRFGVSMRALQQANGITDPNRIFWGQVLTIP